MIRKTPCRGLPKERRVLFLFSLLAICVPRQTIPAQHTASGEQQPLEIAFCAARPSKPPLQRLFFNITLRNRSDHPRWFLLPRSLYAEASASPARDFVDVVEVRSAAPRQKVKIADFMGSVRLQPESSGGFQALLLPGGARVTVRNFLIRLWGETDKPLPVRLVIADEVTIAGSSATQWLAADLLTDAEADVEDNPSNVIMSKHAPDLQQFSVKIIASQEFAVSNALAIRCSSKPQ